VDNSQGFWSFTADSYSAGSSQGGSLTGIADTGTTLMLLSDDVVSSYWGQVDSASSNQGSYVFDCSADLPDFTLSVAGYNAVVPGSYFNYAPNGDGTCYGGLQSSAGIGFNILGDIFLKSTLIIFDLDNVQLGLAAKSGN
jgi:aspergillopepsin I